MSVDIREAKSSDVKRIQELNAELSEKEAEEYDPTIDVNYTFSDEAEKW